MTSQQLYLKGEFEGGTAWELVCVAKQPLLRLDLHGNTRRSLTVEVAMHIDLRSYEITNTDIIPALVNTASAFRQPRF